MGKGEFIMPRKAWSHGSLGRFDFPKDAIMQCIWAKHPSIHPRVKAAPNLLSMAQQSESESEISGKSKEIRLVGYQ
jgi:hypothetical protein